MFDLKLRTMKKIVFIALTVISCACSNIKQEQGGGNHSFRAGI